MGPKQQMDRLAWQWAEEVSPEEVTEEHIDMAYRIPFKACQLSACRRNCRGNPRCVNGIGEREWFLEIDDTAWHDIEDPETERRKPGAFVGLKNLGATCYVNTFIQVWFNNLTFRNAVYAWRSAEDHGSPDRRTKDVSRIANGEVAAASKAHTTGDNSILVGHDAKTVMVGPEKRPTLTMYSDADLTPTTLMGHLQLVFALLQFSNRRYIDPSGLIHCLGLDTRQQQDAQEFSKLFMSVIESQLSEQEGDASTGPSNLIQDQFQGEYSYVTSCSACSSVSKRPSHFLELDLNIKGHNNLDECIAEFLQEEELVGDNQYMCSTCNRKQNAVRRIQLTRLPKVLNLQLLRFVFDRKTGHKKKLNTFIQFPEVLDLTHHIDQGAGPAIYDLSAVLIHRGPSAYSGHYVAHIKGCISQSWQKFNDETIEPVAGKDLHLGNEEDLDGNADKKPRVAKGFHASRNAYMLVYVRREENTAAVEVANEESLPERLKLYLSMDRQRFEDWVTDMKEMRDVNISSGRERQQEIQEIFRMLPVNPGEACEWLDISWLNKWLDETNAANVPAIDNSRFNCPHHKINPDDITNLRCIASTAAEVLYAKYSGGPRLKESDVKCRKCVVERCRFIRTKHRLMKDYHFISKALKSDQEQCEDSYWVGKASLRSWRRLALENTRGHDSTETNCNEVENPKPQNDGTSSVESDGSTAADRLSFNEDIICEDHGELVLNDSCRRLVSTEVWKRLKAYFPAAPEFPSNSVSCRKCQLKAEEEEVALQQAKAMAQEHKAALTNLYLDRHRPTWSESTNCLYMVSQEFLDSWRKFIKDPMRQPPVMSLCNAVLLCSHGGLVYDPETMGHSPLSNSARYVSVTEWTEMKRLLTIDKEVKVERVRQQSGEITLVAKPDVCHGCQMTHQQQQQQELSSFTNAIIFVRKLSAEEKGLVQPQEASISAEPVDSSDPEYTHGPNLAGKRKKKSDSEGPSEKMMCFEGEMASRRSARHRRMRGEKELVVSAGLKLWDLKLQLMKHFSSPPMDQHLYLGSRLLEGNQQTLQGLGVMPGSVLLLRVDEPCDDPLLLDDFSGAARPEKGFKGTGLVGSL